MLFRSHPGDVLPGIPAHRIKAGADYRITDNWVVGGDVVWQSSQYFSGDESNQLKPLAGFAVVNLHTTYDVTEGIQFSQILALRPGLIVDVSVDLLTHAHATISLSVAPAVTRVANTDFFP